MKVETVSEKVILSSIAASVALINPISVEAADNKISIDDLSVTPSERYSYGNTGFKVFSIQQKLLDYDLSVPKEETGIFGVKTHSAIRQFQKLKKLRVDGVAGPETLAALFINNNIDKVEVEDHILLKINEGQVFKLGDRGDAVEDLQKKLADAGFYQFELDGLYGAKTKEAVKLYQKETGLQVDGMIGKETYEHLAGVSLKVNNISVSTNNLSTPVFASYEQMEIPSPTIISSVTKAEKHDLNAVELLQNGDKGQAVKDMQRLLKNKGYFSHKIDGSFGPITEAAIRNYQIQNHLKVDGIAGKQTILHLKTAPSAPMPSRSSLPAQTETSETGDSPSNAVNNIIAYAKKLIGTPYIWGGTTPNGFDCSGFLMYVYQRGGIKIPRVVSDIWSFGKSVDSLQVGDIVFFETYKKGPSHAGIYLGNQQFIHAGSSTGVTISDITMNYWKSRYLGAKRIN